MTKTWTYDAKSRELAEYFLSNEPSLNSPDIAKAAVHRLAWIIQESAEDEIASMRDHGIPTEKTTAFIRR